MARKRSAAKPKAQKLITCVLYRGGSEKVMAALRRRGLNAVSMYHARGSSIGDTAEHGNAPAVFEKDVVTVVVAASEAESIFAEIFRAAEINRPYGGLLYMRTVNQYTPYHLPALPEEPR